MAGEWSAHVALEFVLNGASQDMKSAGDRLLAQDASSTTRHLQQSAARQLALILQTLSVSPSPPGSPTDPGASQQATSASSAGKGRLSSLELGLLRHVQAEIPSSHG